MPNLSLNFIFQWWILSWPKKENHIQIFCRFCILPGSSLFTDYLSSCVLQGNHVRKGEFNECWEPGNCLWSNAYAAARAECLDNPEWHETAETGGAAYDRAWRCLILRTEACRPYSRDEGQLFILSKRKFKPPWF